MQVSTRGLRCGARVSLALTSGPIPSTSAHRVAQWDARRHLRTTAPAGAFGFNNLLSAGNPMPWLRKKLGPQVRDEPDAQEAQQARDEAAQRGELGVFDTQASEQAAAAGPPKAGGKRKPWAKEGVVQEARKPVEKATEHKYSTASWKISHRKLNDLGRQLSGKPVDYAILQMTFSEKRASKRIETMLKTAKKHAVQYKGLDPSKLVVAEAWVNKGSRRAKRLDIKGRSKYGIKIHPDSRMHVVLREGKTWSEKADAERARKLGRIRSAGLVREDKPLRNPAPMWAW